MLPPPPSSENFTPCDAASCQIYLIYYYKKNKNYAGINIVKNCYKQVYNMHSLKHDTQESVN